MGADLLLLLPDEDPLLPDLPDDELPEEEEEEDPLLPDLPDDPLPLLPDLPVEHESYDA